MKLYENVKYLKEVYDFVSDNSKMSTVIKRIKWNRDNYLYLTKAFMGEGVIVYGCNGDNEDIAYAIFDSHNYSLNLKTVGCYANDKFYIIDTYEILDNYQLPTLPKKYKDRFVSYGDEYRKTLNNLQKKIYSTYTDSLKVIPLNNDEEINEEALKYYSKGVNSVHSLGEGVVVDIWHIYLKYLCGNISIEDYYLSELDKVKENLIELKSEDYEINKLLSNPQNIKWDKYKLNIITALRNLDCKTVNVYEGCVAYKIEKENLIKRCLSVGEEIYGGYFIPRKSSSLKFEDITKITFSKTVLYEKENK